MRILQTLKIVEFQNSIFLKFAQFTYISLHLLELDTIPLFAVSILHSPINLYSRSVDRHKSDATSTNWTATREKITESWRERVEGAHVRWQLAWE